MHDTKEVAIYASLHCEHLDDVESVLSTVVPAKGFRRIEQGTVLLYDDGTLALSVEPHRKSFYMSGRYQVDISAATRLLEQAVTAFQGRGMAASIEYQEENEKGEVVSPCFLVATEL